MRRHQQPRRMSAPTPSAPAPALPDEMDLSHAAIGAMHDDDVEDAPSSPALDRPTRAPGGRVVVRDLSDDDDRLARIRRARAKHLAAIAENPFLAEEPDSIPRLPDDDPEWAYKWVRHSLPGVGTAENQVIDTKNLAAHSHGRLLPYHFVRMQDLPQKWAAQLQTFAVLEGKHEGHLVYKDLIAARTPRHLRDMKVAAMDYKAQEQRDSLKRDAYELADRHGVRPVHYTDEERLEGRDYIPRDWEI